MTGWRWWAIATAIAAGGVASGGCAGKRDLSAPQHPAAPELSPSQVMPDEPFRARRPEPLPSGGTFAGPAPIVSTLPNGATLLVHENHELPLVAIEVVIRTGSNGDLPGKSGLAALTAALTEEGTRARSATQLAAELEELEELAVERWTSADQESSRVHVNCLTETLPRVLELLAEMVQQPAFGAEDLERARGIAVTAAIQRRGDPYWLARDELARALYGEKFPWGNPPGGTPEGLRALTRADLAAFHQTWYRPNNATLVVSGDVAPDQLKPLVARHFGGWKSAKLPALPRAEMVGVSPRRVLLLERPGLTQSQVLVAGAAIPAAHPDALKLRLASDILGGLFSSRLNQNLRQDKGYSYGVYSRSQLWRETGTLVAGGGIISRHTVAALQELEKELARFSTGELTDAEVGQAKLALRSSLPTLLETNNSISQALGTLGVVGLAPDYYRTVAERGQAITREELSAVARRYFQPEKWLVVVVGPPDGFESQLGALNLGPVERRAAVSKSAP